MPKKTKDFPIFLGVNVSEDLSSAIKNLSDKTMIPQSRLIRSALNKEFLPKKRLEDKQKTVSLRK